MGNPYDGIILIDKDEGKTSFDAVKRIRRFLDVRKVGHAGTLDPFATGLLIVLLGQGTKLSPYLMMGDKVYLATLRLGIETDTQDLTGRVVSRNPVPELEPESIGKVASGFIGEIEQIPPLFSAVYHQGERAYELARRGIRVELQKRRVRIRSLEISSVALPDVTMMVTCSSGTYMRSLAADLGRELGTGAHLKSLRRLCSGPFHVKDALKLETLMHLPRENVFQEVIIPPSEALPEMKEAMLDDRAAQRIRNGHQPVWEEIGAEEDSSPFPEGYMKLVEGGELVAIAEVEHLQREARRSLRIMRVFN